MMATLALNALRISFVNNEELHFLCNVILRDTTAAADFFLSNSGYLSIPVSIKSIFSNVCHTLLKKQIISILHKNNKNIKQFSLDFSVEVEVPWALSPQTRRQVVSKICKLILFSVFEDLSPGCKFSADHLDKI